VIIDNIKALIDKNVFVPIDYSDCLAMKYDNNSYSGYYKILTGFTQKYIKPKSNLNCCGGAKKPSKQG